MKKTQRNKICKILDKNKIELSYDLFTQKIYVNNIKFNNKDIKLQPWFSTIKGKVEINDDNEVLKLINEIANDNSFNSDEQKKQVKEQEKQKKEDEKKQKELEQQKKAQELDKFIEDFDYNILKNIPKSSWIDTVKIILDNNGFSSKPIVYNRIITKYVLKKSIDEKTKYEKIGYILNDDDKIDDSNPVNYEVFFDNFFYKKEEWENLDKEKDNDRRYCFYDGWQDTYNLCENGKNTELSPERIRTLVRQYAPIKNVYVVNDMYKDWIKNNRLDNALINYIKNIKWDGKDRWGLCNDSNKINENENYICKVLGADQTLLNKKMITYSFLHAMRQILWPTRYNYQHILSFLGDTNTGKTKTLQDMFTFPVGKYYCENLDIHEDAEWTIGAKLSSSIAILWNEKKGINKAANETIKSFIDLINGNFHYQKKHEQVMTNYTSHNICFISYNPKQQPFLSDYSVSYEKRYFIIECKMTEDEFKNKWIHYIEKEREQMWAQLYCWCMNNQEEVNELSEEEINELKIIQSRNKGIDYKDIEDELDYQLNKNSYITDKAISGEQIKNSKDIRLKDHAKNRLIFISNSAFSSLLSQLNWDSRQKSLMETYNIMENIGWKKGSKTIDGHTYRGYLWWDSCENPLLFE